MYRSVSFVHGFQVYLLRFSWSIAGVLDEGFILTIEETSMDAREVLMPWLLRFLDEMS